MTASRPTYGWKVTGLWNSTSSASSEEIVSMSWRSTAARKVPVELDLGLPPDLDRDLVHAQGDRRLGLGGLDPHAFDLVVRQQPVGDRAAQALERVVGALLGEQRHELADLGVVDRVLERVRHRGVALSDVQAQVDHQALADLALGGR